MVRLCVATFLLVTISSVSCLSCLSDQYVIGQQKLTWMAAYTNCRKNNKDLVTIDSIDDADEIEALINKCEPEEGFKKGFWISLSKPGLDPNKNDWHWFRTGAKLNESGYVNWAEGKPGNPAAKCVELAIKDKKFVWNNLMCDSTELRYICQDRVSACE